MNDFNAELKALFEKYNVVFDINGNRVDFFTNGGLSSPKSRRVSLVMDENVEEMEKAADKMV